MKKKGNIKCKCYECNGAQSSFVGFTPQAFATYFDSTDADYNVGIKNYYSVMLGHLLNGRGCSSGQKSCGDSLLTPLRHVCNLILTTYFSLKHGKCLK